DRVAGGFGPAEDVDNVDRHSDLRQLAPHKLSVDMLARDLRVQRDDAIAPVLEELHDAMGWPVGPVGRADHRDRSRIGEKLGDVLVAGQGHGAITVQWTGVSRASSRLDAIAAKASASG